MFFIAAQYVAQREYPIHNIIHAYMHLFISIVAEPQLLNVNGHLEKPICNRSIERIKRFIQKDDLVCFHSCDKYGRKTYEGVRHLKVEMREIERKRDCKGLGKKKVSEEYKKRIQNIES